MFSIVSWNIQYGKGVDGEINLNRIAEVINEDGLPDILCLQEISRNDPNIDNGNDQVNQIKNLFPQYNCFFGVSHDRSGGNKEGRRQFGNLILTLHSPVQVLHHLLPSPADKNARFMARQTTEMVIQSSSLTFRMMNTHLEFFSEKQQIAQVNRIRELHEEACAQAQEPGIDKPNTPFERIERPEKLVICGDFNFTIDSIPYQIITKPFSENVPDLVDAWRAKYLDSTTRSPTCGLFDQKQWKQGPHCRDYFFLSQNLIQKIKEITVNIKTTASDHQPIRLILGY